MEMIADFKQIVQLLLDNRNGNWVPEDSLKSLFANLSENLLVEKRQKLVVVFAKDFWLELL